jgi:hypothetical protein
VPKNAEIRFVQEADKISGGVGLLLVHKKNQ